MTPKVGLEELRHIVWEQMDVRVSPSADAEQLHDILQYKTDVIPHSPINSMRDRLISFIEINRNNLSLSCDGNCYSHHDGQVVYCHNQLMEESNG